MITGKKIYLYDKFIKSKSGTLISIGSFCDPFLQNVDLKTRDILKAIKDFGNPIQIATKLFPSKSVLNDMVELFNENKNQLMVNFSLPDFPL